MFSKAKTVASKGVILVNTAFRIVQGRILLAEELKIILAFLIYTYVSEITILGTV